MFQPNQKAQGDFLESRLYCVAAFGGIRSGKTYGGAEYAFIRFVTNPETTGFIGANSYKQLSQSTLVLFKSKLLEAGLLEDIHYVFGKHPPKNWNYTTKFEYHDGIYSFWNGAQIVTRSLDNYEDIRGAEYGWIWIDETRDTKYAAFTMLEGRLSCPKSHAREIRITTTPNGFDWLYELFDTGRLVSNPAARKNYGFFELKTRLNKFLPDGFYERVRSSYTHELAEQELEGKRINVTKGRVYKTFTDHNIMPCPYDPASTILLSMDFNVEPGTASCWHRYNIEGRGRTYYKFDEIFIETDSDTQAVCKEFKRRYGEHVNSVVCYPDASGKARAPQAKRTNHQIIKDELGSMPGFSMRKRSRNPSVEARVETTKRMFCDSKGKIHAFIDPSCEYSIRDYRQVVWKPGTNEIEKNTTDEVKRMLTHLSDGDGYMFEIEESVAKTKATSQKV